MIKNNSLKSVCINIAVIVVAILIGLPLGSFIKNSFITQTATPSLAPIQLSEEISKKLFEATNENFIVFGDTTCRYCTEGKDLLTQTGVRFQMYYIDKDPYAKNLFNSLHAEGVPVLLSKKQLITGYSKNSWERFILNSSSAP